MTALLKRDLTRDGTCCQFPIRRKTRHRLVARRAELGLAGPADASRAPNTHPNQSSPEVEAAVLRVRKAHLTRGSKKIVATLDPERADQDWPARNTIDATLNGAGGSFREVLGGCGSRSDHQWSRPTHPEGIWVLDYRARFRGGDATRCDRLTVHEVLSRASLVCRAMIAPKSADVRQRPECAFSASGQPRCMLSDGRPALGFHEHGQLSRLGVWLVRIGVIPVLAEPGRPDQNGRQERFHETIKAETATLPSGSIRAQQAA